MKRKRRKQIEIIDNDNLITAEKNEISAHKIYTVKSTITAVFK